MRPYERHRPSRNLVPSGIRSRNSRTTLVFPIPGSPTRMTSRGRLVPELSANASSSRAISRSRPTNVVASPRPPLGRLGATIRASRRPGTPSGFPLASMVIGSSNSKASPTRATVRSPASPVPAAAACSSRAATFTASPVTNELPSRGRPTTTSLVFTPIRSANRSPKSLASLACIHNATWRGARRGPPAPPGPRTPRRPHRR